jgi:hypothetical protein
VVGPAPIVADIALVGMVNVVCQVGPAQDAVAAALEAPDAGAGALRPGVRPLIRGRLRGWTTES